MGYRYLSYILKNDNPSYGGSETIKINRMKSISNGDSANVYQFSLKSHCGTHIDAPNHFFDDGNRVSDCPAEFWLFKFPQAIRVDLKPSEVLNRGKWTESIKPDSDILLFQSGWAKVRGSKAYSSENPGIHPDVGLYLRQNYPRLRAIGIDWISISPYRNRPLGRKAHRVFLDPKGENNPVFIIEDMDLSGDLKRLKRVFVFPLRIEALDSSPCTAVGDFID